MNKDYDGQAFLDSLQPGDCFRWANNTEWCKAISPDVFTFDHFSKEDCQYWSKGQLLQVHSVKCSWFTASNFVDKSVIVISVNGISPAEFIKSRQKQQERTTPYEKLCYW